MFKPTVTVSDPTHAGAGYESAATPDLVSLSFDQSADWHATLQRVHKQAAETHEAFQKAMVDAHLSYLRMVEAIVESQSHSWHGVGLDTSTAANLNAATPADRAAVDGHRHETLNMVARANEAIERQVGSPVATPLAADRGTTPTASVMDIVSKIAVTQTPSPAALHPAQTPTQTAYIAPLSIDSIRERLRTVMLEVVSDKTGYPIEVIDPSMQLEADLGIDSIKRVEILSAIQRRIPELPELKGSRMGAMRSFDEILNYLVQALESGGQLPATVPASSAPVQPATAAQASASEVPATTADASAGLQALLFEIISEKTGYPIEVLNLSMQMESDLGIDSIKRVEILSAVRARLPDIPEVKARELALLGTIGEVVNYMESRAEKKAVTPKAASAT